MNISEFAVGQAETMIMKEGQNQHSPRVGFCGQPLDNHALLVDSEGDPALVDTALCPTEALVELIWWTPE